MSNHITTNRDNNPRGDAGVRPVTDMRGLERLIPFKQTAIREKIATDPTFPQPFRNGRKLLFFVDEIAAWVDSLAKNRVTLRRYVRRSHGAAQPEAR